MLAKLFSSNYSIPNVLLLAFPIVFWQCYCYVGFGNTWPKLLLFSVVALFLLLYANTIFKAFFLKAHYDRYVAFMILGFLLSLFSALFCWAQDVVLTFRAGVSTLVVLYFFFLKKKNVGMEEIIKIVFILAFLYLILWGYAVSQAPQVVFGNLDEITDSRGFFRVALNSLDVVCLLYFISLIKVFGERHRLFWFLTLMLSFALVFLSMSRMIIFSLCIVTLFFLIRQRSFFIVILIVFLFLGGMEILKKNEITSNLISMTEQQISDGDESNLRITEYLGAFELYPLKFVTFLFGNGAPHVQSSYGQYEEMLKYMHGFNRSDAGYVGVYVTYGFFMLALLILLLFKVLFQKVDMHFMPYKMFVIFLYITNLTSYNFWAFGISFMISLYVLDLERAKRFAVIKD